MGGLLLKAGEASHLRTEIHVHREARSDPGYFPTYISGPRARAGIPYK